MPPELRVFGVPGLPEIRPGDDLAQLLLGAVRDIGERLRDGDVVVVTQKAVSKSEGRLVHLANIIPSPFALQYAAEHGKDPRHVEVILRETRRVVRMDHGVLIVETRQGLVCANAGVDASNAGQGAVTLLPLDPDASAQRIRRDIAAGAGVDVAVVVSDTFGRPWRTGQTNVAIGAAGIAALRTYHDVLDAHGYRLRATAIAVVDELAAAAELVMGKVDGVPVAIVRGLDFARPSPGQPDSGARALAREPERDLFR